MKRILITGADSYIGTSFERFMRQFDGYQIDTADMRTDAWKEKDFSVYDTVFHVAGIAHVKETDENRALYYRVNRDIAVETAQKAKAEGVAQFILMSTMSVYGLVTGHITKKTECHPVNAYGKSKLMADEKLLQMQSDDFRVAILRPPMVYGKGCKGNYPRLRSLALKFPVFPRCNNERSMVYIDNLCVFVKDAADQQKSGIFFPQNKEYVHSDRMAELIAECHGKKLHLWGVLDPFVKIAPFTVFKKAFGSLTYEKTDLIDLIDFEQSVKLSEGM